MRKVILLVCFCAMLCCTGCLQALIVPVVATSAVVADRQLCKKKGIQPAAVNPTLVKLVNKTEEPKAETK